MNRYGQMALDHHRQHRPDAYSQIPDPDLFFTEIGDEIAAQVTRVRDEILGQIRPGESPDAYRLRSYQALATAEELILADHHIFQPNPSTDTEKDKKSDPVLDRQREHLAEINRAINTPL